MMDLFRLEVEAQIAIFNNGRLVIESQPQSTPELEAFEPGFPFRFFRDPRSAPEMSQ